MRVLLKIVFSVIFFQVALSQSTIVIDAENKNNLSYVTIQYSDNGFYTDEHGVFDIGDLPNDSLVTLSHIGFETKTLLSSKIKDTIFLKRKALLLENINLNFNRAELTLKTPKKSKNFGSWPLSSKHEIITQIIPDSKIIDSYLHKIMIPFAKLREKQSKNVRRENLKAIVRVNIYNPQESNTLNKIFSSKELNISALKKDVLEIDIEEKSVIIGEKGIVIGLEFLGYISEGVWIEMENSFVRPALSENAQEFLFQKTYLKNVFNDQKTEIGDILTKQNPSGKLVTRNLAIGLTLSIEAN